MKGRGEIKNEEQDRLLQGVERLENKKAEIAKNYQAELDRIDEAIAIEKLRLEAMEKIK